MTPAEIKRSKAQGAALKKHVHRKDGNLDFIKTHNTLMATTLDWLNQEPDPDQRKLDLCHITHSAIWSAYGNVVIKVTPELVAALMLSDIPKDLELLNLPYPAFLIRLEGGSPLGSAAHGDLQDLEIFEGKSEFFDEGLTQKELDMATGRFWFYQCSSRRSLPNKFKNSNQFHRYLFLTRNLAEEFGHSGPQSIHSIQEVKFLTNLMIYISSKQGSRCMRSPVVPKKGKLKDCKVHTLGRDIKLPSGLVEEAKRIYDSGHTPKYRIKTRHIVRGHWRNQAVGPKTGSARRLIWIQPFWKGDEGLQAVERNYRAS